jgi:hypothetical protein
MHVVGARFEQMINPTEHLPELVDDRQTLKLEPVVLVTGQFRVASLRGMQISKSA